MDLETLQTLLTRSVIFLPAVTGIVQAIKLTELIPGRFLPVAAVALGGLFGWFFIGFGATGALVGVVLGLSSVGLYEAVSTTALNRK